MSRREIVLTVAALIVGLLAGALLVGSNEGLRSTIFGTASSTPQPERAYYLVDFSTTSAWLAETQTEMGEELSDAVEQVTSLSTVDNVAQEFVDAESAVRTALSGIYVALVGEEEAADKALEPLQPRAPDEGLALCLGVDYDPYAPEPVMYLYLKVPTELNEDVPEGWERLEAPKDTDLFWLMLGCYAPVEAAQT